MSEALSVFLVKFVYPVILGLISIVGGLLGFSYKEKQKEQDRAIEMVSQSLEKLSSKQGDLEVGLKEVETKSQNWQREMAALEARISATLQEIKQENNYREERYTQAVNSLRDLMTSMLRDK
jgi:septal ring factor EnvC (AmiA/AmiB activator)